MGKVSFSPCYSYNISLSLYLSQDTSKHRVLNRTPFMIFKLPFSYDLDLLEFLE
jgi:hypothetical protein